MSWIHAKSTLDVFSVVLSIFGFGGLLYGCSIASAEGWTSTETITFLVVGANRSYLVCRTSIPFRTTTY